MLVRLGVFFSAVLWLSGCTLHREYHEGRTKGLSSGRTALLVIDIQNCFLKGGSLEVPGGDEVIPIVNKLMVRKGDLFDKVVASQDWHPAGHISFASTHGKKPFESIKVSYGEQTLWPDHCVQNRGDAQFAASLRSELFDKVIRKGDDPKIDSYSAFFGNDRKRSTQLKAYLDSHGVETVFIVGLATDYCVRFTAEDAVRLGFETYLIDDATRGVSRDGAAKAIAELQEKGVRRIASDEILGMTRAELLARLQKDHKKS